MASNSSTITDPDYHDYADWIELYNAGSDTLNLKNYFITDDLASPQKYKFTSNVLVPPHGYLLIWADDRNTGVHTNFKLSASGEAIGIFSPQGALLDTVVFGQQSPDISWGRFPDGAQNLYFFSPASPGASNPESSINNRLPQPVPSLPGGFYASPFSVSFAQSPGQLLRYRRDGKEPGAADSIYSGPLRIDSTSVIRVKAFKEGFLPSPTLSLSYFVAENTALPVFSLITDPANFFSDTAGIYVIGTNGIVGNCSTSPRNWNQDWERPVSIDFYEKDRSKGFKVSAGVQIYGGCSRIYAMKSLALYFRSDYGFNSLNYRLFADRPLTEFNNFILRSSGQDWWRTMFRDAMVQTLLLQNTGLDCQAYRPALVFLNGQYWGIHNIREKLNEHYIGSYHQVNQENIDLIEISKGVTANNGDLTAYNEMISFLNTHSLTAQENYDYIKSIVDIDNYIDYNIAQIYAANGDWPGANVKLWRGRTAGSKWRWMVYDLDFTFGGNSQGQATTNTVSQATAANGPDWPNPPWSTLMLRKMLENKGFRDEFLQRFALHIQTTFRTQRVHDVIDSIKPLIAAEIPRHKARWAQSISLGNDWEANIQVMKSFAINRPPNVRSHLSQKFSLTGSCSLQVSMNNDRWGKLLAHTIELKYLDSAFILFKGIPFCIKAIPFPGYRFVRWEGISTAGTPGISFTPAGNTFLRAVFEPAAPEVRTIVINEINYKSSPIFDTEDWLELYNPLDSTVSLSGWKMYGTNSASYYTFPPGASIGPHGYLVLCRDTSRYLSLRPGSAGVSGNLPFGMSSIDESLRLIDASNAVIDEVHYFSSGAWPSMANGTGSTLALLDPQSDNSQPQSWRASARFGTPGRLNDVYTEIRENRPENTRSFQLFSNFPNPFNAVTRIAFFIPDNDIGESVRVTVKIFSILGNEIATLVDAPLAPGYHEHTFNAAALPSGTYFYCLQAGSFRETAKMSLLK